MNDLSVYEIFNKVKFNNLNIEDFKTYIGTLQNNALEIGAVKTNSIKRNEPQQEVKNAKHITV